jgi:hypothetical protein
MDGNDDPAIQPTGFGKRCFPPLAFHKLLESVNSDFENGKAGSPHCLRIRCLIPENGDGIRNIRIGWTKPPILPNDGPAALA